MAQPFVSYITYLVAAVFSGQTTDIIIEAPPGPAWLASPPAGPYSMSVEGETISFTGFSSTTQGNTVLSGVTRGAAVSHPINAVCLMSVGHFNNGGSGGTPTLQQVTDAGNTTTDAVNLNGGVEVASEFIINPDGSLNYPSSSPLTERSPDTLWQPGAFLFLDLGGLYYPNAAGAGSGYLADDAGMLYYSQVGSVFTDGFNIFYGDSSVGLLCDGDNLITPATSGNTLVFSNNTTPPSTGTIVLPTTVFGSAGALLATPTAWILVNVAGTNRKIPCY